MKKNVFQTICFEIPVDTHIREVTNSQRISDCPLSIIPCSKNTIVPFT